MATPIRKASAFYPRPRPPEFEPLCLDTMRPAPDLLQWVRSTFIDEGGPLCNEEHAHLQHANIGMLWAGIGNQKRGRAIAGTAEIPQFLASRWVAERQEQQMREWFGQLPDFVITIDAAIWSGCSDIEACALIEHELFHCGQAHDEFGAPKFNKRTGRPSFCLRPHDVEEFVGVVSRYGAGAAAAGTAALVQAAASRPSVGPAAVALACGTCGRAAA